MSVTVLAYQWERLWLFVIHVCEDKQLFTLHGCEQTCLWGFFTLIRMKSLIKQEYTSAYPYLSVCLSVYMNAYIICTRMYILAVIYVYLLIYLFIYMYAYDMYVYTGGCVCLPIHLSICMYV